MARTRVKLNRRGVNEVLRSAKVRDELMRRAEAGADAAKAIAPVETGEYRDSIHAVDASSSSRGRALIAADVPYAVDVEVEHRVLGRAIDAAGG